jgi:hypothetical protein
LGVPDSAIAFVSSNFWDIAGAKSVSASLAIQLVPLVFDAGNLVDFRWSQQRLVTNAKAGFASQQTAAFS